MTPARVRLFFVATGIAIAAACAAGPSYHASPAVAPSTQLRGTAMSDSNRVFFDSLTAARAHDSAAMAHPPAAERELRFDTTAGVAWLDILHDTTLERLVQVALRQNRTVQGAVARIREYRADASSARTEFLPDVSINGSEATNQIAFGTQAFGYRAARLTGDMSWELDFWGKIRRGYEAANADVAAQDAAERSVLLSLVSDVATGYLQLLELDQERAIAERTLASRRATLDLARQRYARGVISELDVRQFEAQVAAPAVTLAQVDRATAMAEHNLNVLLGEAPSKIERHGSLAAAVSALRVPDTLSATLLARRPDVAQAERSFAAATARIGATMASNLPAITVVGSYGSQAADPAHLYSPNTTVYQLSVGFSYSLSSLTRGADATAAARARADQAKAAYENAALSALRDANDALVGVRTSRDEVAAQATQADALRHALELAQLRYASGVASYLDVLDAQRNLFSAELALSQAQLEQLTAAVQLYKALGGSWR
ncbi:MAG TPA: efflux transporter outer membrane subunit [Gemmatimonadaceae bacterium]|jgi:multidrug efflux system outer membrane protein